LAAKIIFEVIAARERCEVEGRDKG